MDGTSSRPFGKYQLLERVGIGGMAEIWTAQLIDQSSSDEIVVVKKILPRYAINTTFITMFVQEAKVASVLEHPNIVTIYELGEEKGEYYISMEYVCGADLLRLLTLATRLKQHIPTELCLFLVSELCKGLGYAHSATDMTGKPLDIVHLDVSPANILLSFDGELKLTDFGVAKVSVEGKSSGGSEDRLKGKLGYMSPEQVTGKPVDRRSDLFSLGIILYELLTMKRLFLGKTDMKTLSNIRDLDIETRILRHADTIPPGVAEIIRRALARNVETRFQTAYEMDEAISRYLFEHQFRVNSQSLATFVRTLFHTAGVPAPPVDQVIHSKSTDLDEPREGHEVVKSKKTPTVAAPGFEHFGAENVVTVLSEIAAQHKTGCLKLVYGSRIKQIYFRRGKTIHIESNVEAELFGTLIAEEGLISAAQLEEAIAEQQAAGGKLGDVLVRLGHLNQIQLFRILEQQFEEKFLSSFGWIGARYRFIDDAEPGPNVILFGLNSFECLTRGVRRYISIDTIESILKPVMTKTCTRLTDPPFGAALLKLTTLEYRCKTILEAQEMSIEKLLERHAQDDETRNNFLFVAFLLQQTGHISIT